MAPPAARADRCPSSCLCAFTQADAAARVDAAEVDARTLACLCFRRYLRTGLPDSRRRPAASTIAPPVDTISLFLFLSQGPIRGLVFLYNIPISCPYTRNRASRFAYRYQRYGIGESNDKNNEAKIRARRSSPLQTPTTSLSAFPLSARASTSPCAECSMTVSASRSVK